MGRESGMNYRTFHPRELKHFKKILCGLMTILLLKILSCKTSNLPRVLIRDLKQTTTVTATRMYQNKRSNRQNNS